MAAKIVDIKAMKSSPHISPRTPRNSLSGISPQLNEPITFPSEKEVEKMEKKSSYDEDDTDNYFEDKQKVYNGSEANPEFTNLSLIHISEPTRRTPISYAVF